jgi:uncharacterized membrane protein
MAKPLFYLGRLSKLLWLRATLYALAAVGAALLAHTLGPLAPEALVEALSDEAAKELLNIMAASMLAVATFSLATLVAASGAITTNASPRAAALMLDDKSAQNALAAFIAAFIFSIVGLIAASLNYYDRASLFVLFVETLAVLAFVVLRLLGWIDQLSRIGRVSEAVDRVETATRRALIHRSSFLGGVPDKGVPADAEPLLADKVGYVQHIDVARLDALAKKHGLVVHLLLLPGSFLPLSRAVMQVEGVLGGSVRRALMSTVVIGGARTFEQDPRFGLVVLGEIASRALSPAVNDPGTAIDVVGTAVRLLSVWGEEHWEQPPTAKHERVHVPALSASDVFDDVFRPISRDGAPMLEVGIAVQKGLMDLAAAQAVGFRDAARAHSRRALRLAEHALTLDDDKAHLRRLSQAVLQAV